MDKRRLLNVRETAQYLNISTSTIYKRAAPGAQNPFPFRPKRVGKSLRFRVEDLDRFIEED